VLLVRLQKYTRKTDFLNKQQESEEVKEIKNKENSLNKAIVETFTEHFNFCKVYFFYSNKSEEIKNGDYSLLFDSNYNQVEIEDNSKVYFAAFTYRDIGEPYLTTYKTFIIMDENFQQLKKPFPYFPDYDFKIVNWTYVPRFNIFKDFTILERQVFLLDYKLKGYYEKTARRRARW